MSFIGGFTVYTCTFLDFLFGRREEVAESVEDEDVAVLTLLAVSVKVRVIDTDNKHQQHGLLYEQKSVNKYKHTTHNIVIVIYYIVVTSLVSFTGHSVLFSVQN